MIALNYEYLRLAEERRKEVIDGLFNGISTIPCEKTNYLTINEYADTILSVYTRALKSYEDNTADLLDGNQETTEVIRHIRNEMKKDAARVCANQLRHHKLDSSYYERIITR